MTDCMNMEFYRELYVSRSLKKREKRIIEGLKKKRFRKDLYLIVLAQGKQNPLEFFSVLLLKQHIFCLLYTSQGCSPHPCGIVLEL